MSRRKAASIIAKSGVVIAVVAALIPFTFSSVAASTDCVSDDDAVCEIMSELADLHATVDLLVPDAGIANSLDVKVDEVSASVLAGRYGAAVSVLDAFDREVTALAREQRSYTAISNIMKTKHDTIKNSITNVR
jgi:hypothetical protein